MDTSVFSGGKMGWFGDDESKPKQLYLNSHSTGNRWVHYKSTKYARPDNRLPGASPGFTTFQYLIKFGWTIIPTSDYDKIKHQF